jgi:hypothetical protein
LAYSNSLKKEIGQMGLENDNLRGRLEIMEAVSGKDSQLLQDSISGDTSKVDWAALLLDDKTDDLIISASREKIGHYILQLKK